MPELGPYGSVRGARGNSRPYRDSDPNRRRLLRLTIPLADLNRLREDLEVWSGHKKAPDCTGAFELLKA